MFLLLALVVATWCGLFIAVHISDMLNMTELLDLQQANISFQPIEVSMANQMDKYDSIIKSVFVWYFHLETFC